MSKFYISIRIALLCGALLLTAKACLGQTVADTLRLPQIEVTATRIQQPRKLQPVHVDVIDSTRLSLAKNENIGQLLSMESALFIKSNGPGALSDASQQGLSPEQIQVLWNGIPINHPMLGETNLSLLPTNFFSNVQVSSGLPSSDFGGGLSGGLYLKSNFSKSNDLSISQSAGSFGRFHSGLQASAYENQWNVSLHSQYLNDENDYKFFNRADQQVERRQHNHQTQKNVIASAGYEDGKNQIKTTIWYDDSQNQLPGSVLSNSRQRQDDRTLRWLTRYQTNVGKAQITAKNYLDRVVLNYFEPSNNVQSYSTSRRWLASTSIRYPASRHVKIKGEIRGGLTGVQTNNYAGTKSRAHFSVLVNPDISVLGNRLRIYPAVRLDSYSDFGNVISPSLGLNYALISNKLYLRGQLSRNFNPPTFNDLYWVPGGNPDLKPERSKNAQAGVVAVLSTGILHRVEVTGFYDRVHNGIRWYPNNKGTYTPSNIQDISSKGIKLNTVSNFQPGGGIYLQFRQTGIWNRAEINRQRFPGDQAVGNQMRYVPEWRYKAGLMVRKSFLSALAQYRWVGRRYVTESESISNSLDPYQKVDLSLQARQHWLGITFTGNLQVNNLLNANYEIIQWYAMPRRNFQFTLTATYNF